MSSMHFNKFWSDLMLSIDDSNINGGLLVTTKILYPLKSIAELKRVLTPGGNLLFVNPVGKDAKIMFNVHRIYTYSQIITNFKNLKLVEFSLITDNPNLHDFIEKADPKLSEQCTYGCGCFWFRKE